MQHKTPCNCSYESWVFYAVLWTLISDRLKTNNSECVVMCSRLLRNRIYYVPVREPELRHPLRVTVDPKKEHPRSIKKSLRMYFKLTIILDCMPYKVAVPEHLLIICHWVTSWEARLTEIQKNHISDANWGYEGHITTSCCPDRQTESESGWHWQWHIYLGLLFIHSFIIYFLLNAVLSDKIVIQWTKNLSHWVTSFRDWVTCHPVVVLKDALCSAASSSSAETFYVINIKPRNINTSYMTLSPTQ